MNRTEVEGKAATDREAVYPGIDAIGKIGVSSLSWMCEKVSLPWDEPK